MINQAVILAGGLGERLKPITNEIPKPLAPVNKIPFLDYLIESIKQTNIKNIILLLGYKSEKIIERYSSISKRDIKIDFSVGEINDLTGTRVLKAYNKLDENFLLLYGDNFWPIPLNEMVKHFKKTKAKITTTVFDNKNGSGEYGLENNIYVDEFSRVICYDKKRINRDLNGVDIGYFIVNKQILEPNLSDNISFEENILPRIITAKKMYAFITDVQYYFITSLKTLKTFEEYVISNNIKPFIMK